MTQILFIDDEPIYVKYYVRELKSRGFSIEMVSSATEAVECFSALDFDLVILDLMMTAPDRYRNSGNRGGLETGIFLLQDLLSRKPSTKVIILTNVFNPETLDKCRLPPWSVPVFEKPECSPRRLVQEVRRIVNAGAGGLQD